MNVEEGAQMSNVELVESDGAMPYDRMPVAVNLLVGLLGPMVLGHLNTVLCCDSTEASESGVVKFDNFQVELETAVHPAGAQAAWQKTPRWSPPSASIRVIRQTYPRVLEL